MSKRFGKSSCADHQVASGSLARFHCSEHIVARRGIRDQCTFRVTAEPFGDCDRSVHAESPHMATGHDAAEVGYGRRDKRAVIPDRVEFDLDIALEPGVDLLENPRVVGNVFQDVGRRHARLVRGDLARLHIDDKNLRLVRKGGIYGFQRECDLRMKAAPSEWGSRVQERPSNRLRESQA